MKNVNEILGELVADDGRLAEWAGEVARAFASSKEVNHLLGDLPDKEIALLIRYAQDNRETPRGLTEEEQAAYIRVSKRLNAELSTSVASVVMSASLNHAVPGMGSLARVSKHQRSVARVASVLARMGGELGYNVARGITAMYGELGEMLAGYVEKLPAFNVEMYQSLSEGDMTNRDRAITVATIAGADAAGAFALMAGFPFIIAHYVTEGAEAAEFKWETMVNSPEYQRSMAVMIGRVLEKWQELMQGRGGGDADIEPLDGRRHYKPEALPNIADGGRNASVIS